jgi:hypothetical protein
MRTYRYIGDNPQLKGQIAIGRYENGVFKVQVDGRRTTNNNIPNLWVYEAGRCLGNWAYGWHTTSINDWRIHDDKN